MTAYHEIHSEVSPGPPHLFRGEIDYARLESGTPTIAFVNRFKLDDNGLIGEYLMCADTSRLWGPVPECEADQGVE